VRKAISILLAIAVLSVSAVPLLPATACPSTQSIQGRAMHMQAGHQGHQHRIVPLNDWQTCRIECGCGCHRSIDSLPHLLAPHAVSLAPFRVEMVVADASAEMAPVLQARQLVLPTPPPIRD